MTPARARAALADELGLTRRQLADRLRTAAKAASAVVTDGGAE